MLSILITKQTSKGTQEICEVLHMSIALVVVMVSWVFAYIQTHQTGHVKYEQFFVYQFFFTKAAKKYFPIEMVNNITYYRPSKE